MGYPSYSSLNREIRAASIGYKTKPVDEIFVQNKKKEIHESMSPDKALLREARDSENHPNSFPIIFALDVTGSMGRIPHELVKDGLPKIVGGIIQSGIPDPQILFLGIGDHVYDKYPLQVGQFESGDEELDTWLTRTYIEGGGGGNDGESYLLAWYFAAFHTVTDAWAKRKQKGLIFTIGDEPSIKSLPVNVIESIMGQGTQTSYSDVDLLELASEKYDVYHLHMMNGSAGYRSLPYWKSLLGQRCIEITSNDDVPKRIIEIVDQHAKTQNVTVNKPNDVLLDTPTSSDDKTEMML